LFWLINVFILTASGLLVFYRQHLYWHSDFSTALWLTICASVLLFIIVITIQNTTWRLSTLLFPYLLLLGILAYFSDQIILTNISAGEISVWIYYHAITSILTYALLTLATLSALSSTIQEGNIRSKRLHVLSQRLPSVTSSDNLFIKLLILCAFILFFAFISGMATQYMQNGRFINIDHKTILILSAFIIIIIIIFLHIRGGIRGRLATWIVLFVYLFMSLGYLGVKFVKNILLAHIDNLII
jgi:ABC-type uncharacterized transport system permease subunit